MDDEKQRHGFTVLETDSEGPVNAKIDVVEVSVGKDKTFFPQKSAQAEVAVVKIDRNSGNDKDDQNGDSKSNGSSSNVNAEASVGSAQAGVWGGIGGGVEAGASGIKASVGPVSAKAGVGINTGLGIKDDSLMVEVMGSGFQVGKKMGAKILGSSVEIDLGKIIKNKRC